MKTLIKKAWFTIASIIIGMALIFSCFRGLTPWISQYKVQVSTQLSKILGETVSIGMMETGWNWFEPVIRLNQVELSHGGKQDLTINQLIVGIDLWSSLTQWQLQPEVFLAEGINLEINEKNGNWHVKGLENANVGHENISLPSLDAIIEWVFNLKRIDFKNVKMTLRFENGTIIPLSSAGLAVENVQGFYKIKANATTRQTVKSSIGLLSTLRLVDGNVRKLQGTIYVDFKNVLLSQWQSLLPKNYHQFASGNGRFRGWIDLKKTRIQNLQGKINISDAEIKIPRSNQLYFVQEFNCHFAGHPQKNGWSVSAKDIGLRTHGEKFANQSLKLDFDSDKEILKLISPNLDLRLLYLAPISWPGFWNTFINNHLRGNLKQLSIRINEKKLSHLFTRFKIDKFVNTKLKIQAQGVSGVIGWQKDSGKLKIDSTNFEIKFDKYSPIKDMSLLTEVNWYRNKKQLLEVNLYSNVKHDNLLMSNNGRVEIRKKIGDSTVDFKSQFIVKNGEFWQPFIPDHVLEKGLKEWLTKNIKHIGNITGELSINGRLNDFPYERNNGEFLIATSFSDASLAPLSGWPIANKLGGALTVQGRNLEAAIYQGKFGRNNINRFKLKVDNLGLNKEIIRIHTQVSSQSKAILDYLFLTPLESHLQKLKNIQVDGPIDLDIQLEAPFFDENHPIYLLGEATLKNNDINVKYDGIPFPLRKGYGHILFNQRGLASGDLHGLMWRQPMNIRLSSLKHALENALEVSLNGFVSVDDLSKIIPSPIWQFIRGKTSINADLKITENSRDFDSYIIQSDLKGISINLPEPLHKTAKKSLPTATHILFNSKKGLRKQVKMGGLVSANMWYSYSEDHLKIDRGEIRLGGGEALLPDNPGIQVVGTLPKLSISPWLSVFSNFSCNVQGFDYMDKFKLIDLNIGNINIFDQNFSDFSSKITQPYPGKWQIKLKQANLDMDMTYHIEQNLLKGVIKKLVWKQGLVNSSLSTHFMPSDIPNLNIKINSLNMNQIPLGELVVEGRNFSDHWKLDLLTLQAPYYNLNMNGEWHHTDGQNLTKLRGQMLFSDLGGALSRWNIKPVVSASWGQIDFDSQSPTTLFGMDISKLNAQLKAVFRHGVVTELSKETEEKIGLGKLLSILSLQTIPRRLQLDFSDLSNKGYSFDVFQGEFNLIKGKLTTQNSDIDGPVAYGVIKGSLNLIERTYDVNLRIVPHITASLPIVATIAGGPLAGAVAWIVSKIITQEMHRVTGYTYKIDGPWDEPQVRQLHIDKQN